MRASQSVAGGLLKRIPHVEVTTGQPDVRSTVRIKGSGQTNDDRIPVKGAGELLNYDVKVDLLEVNLDTKCSTVLLEEFASYLTDDNTWVGDHVKLDGIAVRVTTDAVSAQLIASCFEFLMRQFKVVRIGQNVILEEEVVPHVDRTPLDVALSVHYYVKDGFLVNCMIQCLSKGLVGEPGKLRLRHSVRVLVQYDERGTRVRSGGTMVQRLEASLSTNSGYLLAGMP